MSGEFVKTNGIFVDVQRTTDKFGKYFQYFIIF